MKQISIIFFFILLTSNNLLYADTSDFQKWLVSFKSYSIKNGISEKTFDEVMKNARYLPKVNQQEKFFYLKEKKPILPSIKELEENISSRSAKLRYLVKRDDSYNFETDILKKFEYLLKIEAFGDRL